MFNVIASNYLFTYIYCINITYVLYTQCHMYVYTHYIYIENNCISETPEIAYMSRDAAGNILVNKNGFVTCTSEGMKLIIKILINI